MLSNKIPQLFNIYFLIYLTFALDSLMKIKVDFFNIHLGLLTILLILPFLVINSFRYIPKALFRGPYLHLFFLYNVLSLLIFNPENSKLLFYILMIYVMFLYVYLSARHWSETFFYYFQVILLVSGFIQFFAYHFFAFQISFFDISHYDKGFSVSQRLRGFFIEPNWYAISLGFNSIMLIKNELNYFLKNHYWILFFTLFAFIFNASIAIFGMIVILYLWYIGKKSLAIALLGTPIAILLAYWLILYRTSVSVETDMFKMLNYYSRLEPLIRVINFQMSNGVYSIIFGNGFGSWGTLAIEQRLSVLVFEVNPMSRDGSELPVLIFELGLLGFLIFMLDIVKTYSIVNNTDYHLKMAVILFIVCFIFYPIFKFWMYMPYYFYIRYLIYDRRIS